MTSVIRPFIAWKARRRDLLMKAFCSEFGVHGHPADWQDFCEYEFAKFQRGEIPASKYIRNRSQPGQPAQL